MVKSFTKVLVVVAMLVSFVGQVLAYSSMSCEMSNQSHMKMDHGAMTQSDMSHSDMDHSDMDHASMSYDTKNNQEECCGADCVCPTNACTNISIVSSEPNSAYLPRINEGVTFQPISQTKSISTSLYRPPIFA